MEATSKGTWSLHQLFNFSLVKLLFLVQNQRQRTAPQPNHLKPKSAGPKRLKPKDQPRKSRKSHMSDSLNSLKGVM